MDSACQTSRISAGTSPGNELCSSAFCLRVAVVIAATPPPARGVSRVGGRSALAMISPPKGPNGEALGPAATGCGCTAEFGEDQLGEAVGLFQVRVAAEDEGVDAQLFVFPHPRGDGFRVADERRPGPAADQSHPGPEVRADLQALARSVVERLHARLTMRVHAGEDLLRAGDRRLVDAADQRLRVSPGFLLGFAHDDMEADAETHLCGLRPRPVGARRRSSRPTWSGGSPQVR